jgi:hypothetical protein
VADFRSSADAVSKTAALFVVLGYNGFRLNWPLGIERQIPRG